MLPMIRGLCSHRQLSSPLTPAPGVVATVDTLLTLAVCGMSGFGSARKRSQ